MTPTERLEFAIRKLQAIVVDEGCDRGVVLLSQEGPTHPELIDGKVVDVYNHQHFSPLGDALIDLLEFLQAKHDHIESPKAPQYPKPQKIRNPR